MRSISSILLLLLLLLNGCGYKPSATYAKKVLGESVYVEVEIYGADPENAVLIKDALLQALITRFRVTITRKKSAQTTMKVKLQSLTFTPIEYDNNGYIIAKRALVTLLINRIRNKVSKSYTVSGYYDFSVAQNGVVSDEERFKAIRFASLKAIDSLVTKLAVEGSLL